MTRIQSKPTPLLLLAAEIKELEIDVKRLKAEQFLNKFNSF